jgi:hypothetical protein
MSVSALVLSNKLCLILSIKLYTYVEYIFFLHLLIDFAHEYKQI